MSRKVEESCRRTRKSSGSMPTVCHSSTLNSRLLDLNSTEQSENVYENKGQVQKVARAVQCRGVVGVGDEHASAGMR
jgi:hypothetical protein